MTIAFGGDYERGFCKENSPESSSGPNSCANERLRKPMKSLDFSLSVRFWTNRVVTPGGRPSAPPVTLRSPFPRPAAVEGSPFMAIIMMRAVTVAVTMVVITMMAKGVYVDTSRPKVDSL